MSTKVVARYGMFLPAVIFSITLHCILITALIWFSICNKSKIDINTKKDSIETLIINSDAIIQQEYNHHQLQQKNIDSKHKYQCHNEEQIKQKTKNCQKRKLVGQGSKKNLKKEPEKNLSKTNGPQLLEKRDNVMKKNIVGKNQKKNFAKQFKEVDALLNQLTSAKVVPKTKFYTEKINNEQQRLSQSPEINSYKRRLIQAISSKFYDASRYNGEICNLYIRLAPSGALISIETANNANSALCQAAISAAKMATIPKPPNMEVYEIFKNATLRFSPDQANELK